MSEDTTPNGAWTATDEAMANADGWALSVNSGGSRDGMREIQRYDEAPTSPFEDDYHAARHVLSRALAGGLLERRAVASLILYPHESYIHEGPEILSRLDAEVAK